MPIRQTDGRRRLTIIRPAPGIVIASCGAGQSSAVADHGYREANPIVADCGSGRRTRARDLAENDRILSESVAECEAVLQLEKSGPVARQLRD
ncbi:MAG: hypothetical protein KF914_09915 [Rhizobiaceae bacterium]|nr:hypothetical protein [Rhizobiaceae bacterium]